MAVFSFIKQQAHLLTLVGLPGFGPGSREPKSQIEWRCFRKDLVEWLDIKNYNEGYRRKIVRELERHVGIIRTPMDVVSLFKGLTHGQQHNLIMAVRVLFNFVEEAYGVDEFYLNRLRKAIPKDIVGVDVQRPEESQILTSLVGLRKAPVKYQAFYNLLLDSGLRMTEAARVINNFKGADDVDGALCCPLGYFRGTKLAYFAYMTKYSLQLIEKVDEKVAPLSASAYFHKRQFIMGKYLRKFAFDKMIELEIPESIADFIQGRVPIKIGAKHYMALARQASKFYPRYMTCVDMLRNQAQLCP